MDYVDAAFTSNEITEKCGIEALRKHKNPEPRLFTDLGIEKEGYCVYCEGGRLYKSIVQHCINFYVKSRELNKDDFENDLIIY